MNYAHQLSQLRSICFSIGQQKKEGGIERAWWKNCLKKAVKILARPFESAFFFLLGLALDLGKVVSKSYVA